MRRGRKRMVLGALARVAIIGWIWFWGSRLIAAPDLFITSFGLVLLISVPLLVAETTIYVTNEWWK